MKKQYAFELFDTAEEAALRGVPLEVYVGEPDACSWIKDGVLTSIVGYHMDCLNQEGATRLMSGNVSGFRFCPFCGRRLRFQVVRVTRVPPEVAARFVAAGDAVSVVERLPALGLVRIRVTRSGMELLWHPDDLETVDRPEGH